MGNSVEYVSIGVGTSTDIKINDIENKIYAL